MKTVRKILIGRYADLMRRCYNTNYKHFHRYGGRGICIAESWITDSETFYTWFTKELQKLGVSDEAFLANSSKYSIDRKDPDGHYTPENCQIATTGVQQARNKSGKQKRKIKTAEGKVIEI